MQLINPKSEDQQHDGQQKIIDSGDDVTDHSGMEIRNIMAEHIDVKKLQKQFAHVHGGEQK